MDLNEVISKLDQYINNKTRPERKVLEWVLNEAINIDAKYRNALLYKCARAILPYDLDLFWEISKSLFPSITYIFLMSIAIEMRSEYWKSFYYAGESCIEGLPYNEKSLAYAELSRPIIALDRITAHKLSVASLKVLPFSSPSILGGVAINLAKNFVGIGFNIRDYIGSILNIVSAVSLIEPIEKIHILAEISLYILSSDRELALKAVEKAAYMMRIISIFDKFEAEAILSRAFSILFDNPKEFLKYSEKLPEEAQSAVEYALVKMLQKSQRKPFYEIDLSELLGGNSEVVSKIDRRLKRKKELREKIGAKLNRIINSRNKL